jgi:hypothetical protein
MVLAKRIRIWSVVLIVVAVLAPESFGSPNPGTENYTSITTTGQLGGNYPTSYSYDYIATGPTTVTSPGHLSSTNPAYSSPGSLDGEGIADFGTLKSRIKIWGPAALNGSSRSLFNDHWTITNASLTGTTGTTQLAYNLSGATTVLDTVGNPVASNAFSSLSLIVDLNPSTSSNGTRVLDYHTPLDPGPTQVLATPGGPTVTVPFTFTYGVPFGIRTSLTVWAETDNGWLWTDLSPYFENYGGGAIDEVTVDFLSTAELIAIVIPDDPAAHVRGGSLVDYTDLVSTVAPLPTTMALMGLGLVGVLARRKRR